LRPKKKKRKLLCLRSNNKPRLRKKKLRLRQKKKDKMINVDTWKRRKRLRKLPSVKKNWKNKKHLLILVLNNQIKNPKVKFNKKHQLLHQF